MTVIDDIRAQHPGAYDDLSDGQLASAYRKKFYSDMDATDFYKKAGLYHLIDANASDNGDPASNGLGTDWQNAAAGAVKAVSDTLRGVAQTALAIPAFIDRHSLAPEGSNPNILGGAYDSLKADQADANARDAALMHTKAGIGGDIAGNVGLGLLGGGLLKGAGVAGSVIPAGYKGAAVAGGLLGATQPLATDQGEGSRLFNAGLGTAAGVAGHGIANVAGAALRAGKGLLAPFFDSGQDQIVANTLSRFGGDAAKRATPSQVPGVNADLAEQTGDAGIAQLRRAVGDSDPAIARQFAEQQAGNNASRLGLLQATAGTDADVAAAKSARDTLAQAKYGQAFDDFNSQQIAREQNAAATMAQGQSDAASKFWPDEAAKTLQGAQSQADSIMAPSAKMQELGQRPIIQQAAKQAKTIAANAGIDIGDPMNTLQGQHYVKMALDDALNTAPQMGIGKAEQNAIAGAKREFVGELERQNPAYGSARQAFSQGSGPVNRLELAQGLLGRVTANPADIDSLGNQVIRPDAFGRAVGSLDQMASKVTGQKNASAANILSPQQQGNIQSLLGDLSRVKVANNVGKSAGSNTVQNLASQNLLGEAANGLGLPGLADSGLLGTVLKPLDTLYKLFGTNDTIKTKLAGVIANPQAPESQAIIARMTAKQRSALADVAAGTSGLVSQSSALGVSQQPSLQR